MTVDVINSAIIRVRIVHRFITITITIAITITITTTITVPITITINIRKKPEFGVHAQESFTFAKILKFPKLSLLIGVLTCLCREIRYEWVFPFSD